MPENYEQKWFASADGKHKAALYVWRPQGAVKGIVQIVHGMREHMGRYDNVASYLTQQGFVVCGNDHLGHGRTVEPEGTFGYFGEEDGCRILMKDCHRVSAIIRRQYPGVPVFLLGHSMGSFIGRLYILHFARELSGFICMGTSGTQPGAAYGRAMAEMVVRTQGAKAQGSLLHKMAFGNYLERFLEEKSPSAWLSRDSQVYTQYDDDPLCQPLFTNQGFADLFTMILAVTGKDWAGKVDKTLPVLLMAGLEDPVGQYGKGVVQVYERLKMAGVLDVKCKLYPEARHELLNELNREEVYYDLVQWMGEHMDIPQSDTLPEEEIE